MALSRRYGSPNFEKIFGKPLEHGVDEPEKNEFAVEGDEKPSGSTPASGAVPKASVPKQPATVSELTGAR